MIKIKFRAWNVWKKKIDNWQEMLKMDLNNVFTGLVYEREHIMQYTGLKDKNGIEIYEGDIVRVKYTDLVGESISTNHVFRNPFDYELGEVLWLNYSHELKIIGNIYENKELLK